MKYTLCFETDSCRRIAVTSSNSLLKLCKIRKIMSKNSNWHFCIVETKEKDDKFSFTYDEGWLFDYELYEFNRFRDKVDSGNYYKSYDYSRIVNDNYLATL